MLCKRHTRFSQMRSCARQHGKSVPSLAELEALADSLRGFRCPGCLRKMNWMAIEGQATVVSLQHDRSGYIRLLCRSCNARHASLPGDSFYEIPTGHKFCPDCKRVLKHDSFHADRSGRWKDRSTYCRECSNARLLEWRRKNREACCERRRAYYHKRIADGNPIPR